MKVPNRVDSASVRVISLSRLQNEGSQLTDHKNGTATKSIKATE